MTNARAAEMVQSVLDYRLNDCYSDQDIECLRVAITALKSHEALVAACEAALAVLGAEKLDRQAITEEQGIRFQAVLHLTAALARARGEKPGGSKELS